MLFYGFWGHSEAKFEFQKGEDEHIFIMINPGVMKIHEDALFKLGSHIIFFGMLQGFVNRLQAYEQMIVHMTKMGSKKYDM